MNNKDGGLAINALEVTMNYPRLFLLLLFLFNVLSCSSIAEEDLVPISPNPHFSVSLSADAPYFYHFEPNSFILDGDNKKAIASESLEDIEIASRLGFKYIEANIWRTNDGRYVCIHGTDGTFGPEVKSIDNSIITTEELRKTRINSVSLEWIKTYVRYDSDYQIYQTTIPSLEEFCATCKQNHIGILAGVVGERRPVEICLQYLSDDLIVYSPSGDIRNYFNGCVLTWNNSNCTSVESLLEDAHKYGSPYICALGETAIAELNKQNDFERLIKMMHDDGYMVGWASVYTGEVKSMKYLKAGMDVSGSGHEVNSFEANYETFDLNSLICRPNTTGFFHDGKIILSAKDTLSCGSPDTIPLGKGSLSIRFSGAICIQFGSLGSRGDRYSLKSDGNELFVFTDYFYQRPTRLIIYSLSNNTTISYFVYSTSVC